MHTRQLSELPTVRGSDSIAQTMRTFDGAGAAASLKTTLDTVSDKIPRERLPATEVGRAWGLVDEDLVEWLRGRYGLKDWTLQANVQNATPLAVPQELGAWRSMTMVMRRTLGAVAPGRRRRERGIDGTVQNRSHGFKPGEE